MNNKRSNHSRSTWSWPLIGGVVVVGALLGCADSASHSSPSHSPPTEREKQEAGTRAILREYGRPGQSEAEIDRGAKAIVDEWEKVSQ